MSAETHRAPGPGATPEADLRRLVDNLPGMAYSCRNDADRTMLFVSGGSRVLSGFAPTDLVGSRVVAYARLIHDEDRQRVLDEVDRATQDARDFTLTYRLRRADGSERWVWEQGRGVYDMNGEALYLEGYVIDITGRYELATQLAEVEAWNRVLMDQPLVGVYVIEGERFRYANQRLATIFGRTVDQLLALRSVLDVVHPRDRGMVITSLHRLGSGKAVTDTLRFRAIDEAGKTIHVEAHRSAIQTNDERVILGVLIDVTEQVEAERRAQHLQKMEAMGRLAAGIAHDFRNVLATIRVTTQLLREGTPDTPDSVEDIRDILDAVDRGTRLSQQLMDLGVDRPALKERLSVPDEVMRLAPLLRRILGPEVRLEEEREEGLPEIVLDRVHLEQILMNLVVNARDAMMGKGRVTVRCLLRDAPAEGTPSVCLQVSDTGPGVPTELRSRVFDPYFTTKEDKGTGLGLTNVWSIARSYGGSVGLESEVGRGSTFSIYFPVPESRPFG